MKTHKIITQKITCLVLTLLTLFIFVACNPNEDTGGNLVVGDINDDPEDGEIDIYVINENTLFGLRDNNGITDNGTGEIEVFLNNTIPGYVPSTTPAFNDYIGVEESENEGSYTNVGLIVSGTSGTLYSYNIPSGELLWQTDLGGTTSSSPSVISPTNTIFEPTIICVGTNNGQLHFITGETGQIFATYTNPTGFGFDSKAIYDFATQTIVAGSTDGYMYYFNLSGSLITSYNTGAPISAGAAVIQTENGPQITVGNINGDLFRLTMQGQLVWKNELAEAIYATPRNSNSKIYVTTLNGKVYQINLNDGTIEWEFQADGSIYSEINVIHNRINNGSFYFTCTDGSVYALDSFGNLQWKANLGDGMLYSTPRFVYNADNDLEHRLYVNTINGVYGLRTNSGAIFSSFEITHSPNADVSGNFKSSPVIFVSQN